MQTIYAKVVSGGKFLAACCPQCVTVGKTQDTKFHLYINKDKWVYCYRCGYKTSFTKFSSVYRIDIDNRTVSMSARRTPESFEVDLQQNTLKFDDSFCSNGAIAYLLKRNLTEELIKRFNVRLGTKRLFGRIAFVDEINKYYVARAFLPGVEPKTLNPANSDRPLLYYKKGTYDTVYLVEGSFDLVPFYKTDKVAFALLGKDISDFQFRQLAASRMREVVIALDPDAFDAAKKLAQNIINRLPLLNVGIMMYDDKSDKDPADYDVELFGKTSIYWVRRYDR